MNGFEVFSRSSIFFIVAANLPAMKPSDAVLPASARIKNILVVSAFHIFIFHAIIRTLVHHIPHLDDLIQGILKIHLARLQGCPVPHEWEDGWVIVGRSPEMEVNEDGSVILRRRHAMGIPIVFPLSRHGYNVHDRSELCSVAGCNCHYFSRRYNKNLFSKQGRHKGCNRGP